jgi:hypothetical protein
MCEWRCCKKDPPAAGLKILCMNRGDFFVAQRFDEKYFPIPFCDSKYAKMNLYPELWCKIDFMKPYSGYVRFRLKESGRIVLADEFKEIDFEAYYQFVDALYELSGKTGQLK